MPVEQLRNAGRLAELTRAPARASSATGSITQTRPWDATACDARCMKRGSERDPAEREAELIDEANVAHAIDRYPGRSLSARDSGTPVRWEAKRQPSRPMSQFRRESDSHAAQRDSVCRQRSTRASADLTEAAWQTLSQPGLQDDVRDVDHSGRSWRPKCLREHAAATSTTGVRLRMTKGWSRYYDAARDGRAEETLLLARSTCSRREGHRRRRAAAVDLGCGEGRDTAELLRRGWRVLAIDAEREAVERLRARNDLDSWRRCSPSRPGLARSRRRNGGGRIWSARASRVPFCPPDQLPALWERIPSSLRRGGRFSGQLFR